MMKDRTYNGKTVIWESKLKQFALLSICFAFTAIAITLYDFSSYKFWCTVILFGVGGIHFLVRFVNPKNLFVKPSSKLGKKIIGEWFIEDQANLGSFLYSDTGFVETQNNIKINWKDVESIFTHKQDLWVIDDICLDVFSKDESIHLNESTPGWYQFIGRMQTNLNINPNWIANVAQPAFEKKFTLIFDKSNRNQEDAERLFYRHTAGNTR